MIRGCSQMRAQDSDAVWLWLLSRGSLSPVWKLEYSVQVKELGADEDGLSKVMCVLTWVNSD